jgi:formate--tetrahydrofolate ligase
MGIRAAVSDVWAGGGPGGAELAEQVVQTVAESQPDYRPLYDDALPIPEKLEILAKDYYGADGVEILPKAKRSIAKLEALGLDKMPICTAKTFHSISDDSALKGAPSGWELTINDVYVSAGAGFIVALAGDVLTMPGLPKRPAAVDIDIDEDGKITGLF